MKTARRFVLMVFLTSVGISPLLAQWVLINRTDGSFIQCLAVSGTNLFAGTFGSGTWRRPLSEMITSVEQTSAQLPEGFALYQNYPNPFNPSSTIAFSLPGAGYVTLKVFNTLGEEVASLVSQELSAGTYETRWDASGTASGIYFYRLQAGNVIETKKLVLLR